MFRLDGKKSLVTGAASGIGAAIARGFAAQGAEVWVADLDAEGGKAVVSSIADAGGQAHYLELDVTDSANVKTGLDAMLEKSERLDILVNNAGVGHVGSIVDTEDADWDRMMNVNAKGVFLCAQAAVRQMRAQDPKGGVIVNMASVASLIAVKDRFAYCASKGAVLQMTRCIAIDHVADGIRCNCICPARVHTAFVDDYLKKFYPGQEAEMFTMLEDYQPLGRMGKPEEIAALAVFLASDEASFVTGAAYPIDGGVTAV